MIGFNTVYMHVSHTCCICILHIQHVCGVGLSKLMGVAHA